jgi:hypothetical protein
MLPPMKDLKIEVNRDLEVVEIRIDRGRASRLVGVARNLTGHPIAAADIHCDVTDGTGTQLGGVVVHLDQVPASGTKRFEAPLKQTDAWAVLVREIETR